MIRQWIKGIFTHRPERLLASIGGIALTVALLAFLGIFLAASSASLTARSVADIAVDWQVLLAPGSNPPAVAKAIARTPSYQQMERVGYAAVAGFTAATGGTVQTTGPGKVLGIGPRYKSTFPREIRQLAGTGKGVLIAQQTAANLHVRPGDSVTIERMGLSPVQVTVAGIVALPYADSLFQAVGIPAGTAPQAPPDNVLLIPRQQWRTIFAPQAAIGPESVRTEFHVRLRHQLPPDPATAYTWANRLANNLEARLAGSVAVGNNLAARLDAARTDALYARVLFLFLGLPGAILGMLLTLTIAASGTKHRLRQQALLRIRGASPGKVLSFAAVEALLMGGGGAFLGALLTWGASRLLIPGVALLSPVALAWLATASTTGFVLALSAVLWPAWRRAKGSTVAASRGTVRPSKAPLWRTLHLDLLILGAALAGFWRTASAGYQVVLAPEGVPQTAVHYEAFLVPLLLWIGGVLVGIRCWESFVLGRRPLLTKILAPLAQNLSTVVAASLSRQRRLITRGVVLIALAFAFAVSTAIFNTTYNAQSKVDARLTNGADVTVRGTTAVPAASKLAAMKALPGVAAAQPMMHRFAYVGNDLQDIYGIDPQRIGKATSISNAYFADGNATSTLAALARQPDGILVSEETRRDFQLRRGDRLNLRLQFPGDHQYHVVPFRFIGVVREFPTAPTDSFLVANAGYIAKQTGSKAREVVLIRARNKPAALSARVKEITSGMPGVRVTDIGSTQKVISSSLTAVDLHGLTRLELIFAVLLVMAATGLILALGWNERLRSFAILSAVGARRNQLRVFIWSESVLMLGAGTVLGTLLGWGIAQVLVRVLKGVFDPPPEHLVVPWNYLACLALAAILSTVMAALWMARMSRRPVVEELRKL